MKVAFLGLGTMGAPMAHNIGKQHELIVWNRSAARAQSFARVAATPAEAVRGAEVVVLMLSDPAAVDAVLDGVLEALPAGAIVVDMSTVDPATARRSAERVRARGGDFLDAPVSGSRKPAVEGTLLILAGGAPATIERARPVLACMGRVLHLGDVGQGMAMKLVLNGLGAHMMTGFAAVLTLGKKLGLRPQDMLDVISGGAFSSPLYASKGPRIFARNFDADFSMTLFEKDQRLVLATAQAAGYPMPTLEAVLKVIDEAIAAGHGALDLSGVIRLFETWAGVTVQ
jgi:3-hydroxyisobutyrate dehydrogenase-like beta-hydroxyacid dehydrogenase